MPFSSLITRISYPLDLHCSVTTADGLNRRPVFGQAVIAYDGLGRWWIEAITVHSRHYGRPDIELAAGGKLWRAIAVELEASRGEDVASAINVALASGQHMALFDEHLPLEQVRRGPPPHVGAALRRAGAAIGQAARTFATAAGLVLMLGSIVAIGALAEMPWPGHQRNHGAAYGPTIAGVRP